MDLRFRRLDLRLRRLDLCLRRLDLRLRRLELRLDCVQGTGPVERLPRGAKRTAEPWTEKTIAGLDAEKRAIVRRPWEPPDAVTDAAAALLHVA